VIGRRLSRYRIEERLRAGEWARSTGPGTGNLGRDVALEVLPPGALTPGSEHPSTGSRPP